MKSRIIFFLMIISLTGFSTQESGEVPGAVAERFSPNNLKKMVFSTSADPHWLKFSDRFWYAFETGEGKLHYIVDPAKKEKRLLFDNVVMAARLTEIIKDPFDSKHLPIENIEFVKDETAIRFEVVSSEEEEEKKKDPEEEEEDDQNRQEKDKKKNKKRYTFEYDLRTGKLDWLEDFVKPEKRPEWASISPDGQTVVFSLKHNLYWMDRTNYEKYLRDKKDTTLVQQALTEDGEENYSYGRAGRAETDRRRRRNAGRRGPAPVVWSRDSKRFAMIRTDQRKVNDLWVVHNTADPRPELETYKYHMPGESEAPQDELLIFDMVSKAKLKVQADRFKDQTLSISTAPGLEKERDDEYRPRMWLAETSDKLFFTRTSRDLRRVDVCVADAATGEVRVLIEERLNTYVETRDLWLLGNGKELIHWSERDGWAHFYLFDGEGKLRNKITSGPYHCEDIVGVDAKNRVLYFTANGKEKREDPYYLHLYSVRLDGTGLMLLNPGDFNHAVRMADSNRFFVNTYSRVDTAPVSEVRDNLGRKLMELEKVDLSLLFEAGYKFPEPFKVKADDGVTDLYGVLYKPFDFDSTKKYPIIAYVYPGPQTEAVNKSFSSRMDRTDRLAQFGFIIMTVGNRGGHPSRSKWYHNYGYGDLRDYGLGDKKAAIEQLARRHEWVDIGRVGIFGHSGGGFMSTAAMLVYPDFFKVAVSSSGNHENNIYNRWWSEKHHGVKEVVDKDGKITFEYDIEKNSELAKNLKGHLLLCTGDIDDNVHPANTIRMAQALIKANKRFDFFLFPGQRHGYGDMNEYFFWLQSEYFCKHLLGAESLEVDIAELNRQKEMTGEE